MGIEEEDARRRCCEGVRSLNFVVFRFMVPRRRNLWLFVIDSTRGSQRVREPQERDVGRRVGEKAGGRIEYF